MKWDLFNINEYVNKQVHILMQKITFFEPWESILGGNVIDLLTKMIFDDKHNAWSWSRIWLQMIDKKIFKIVRFSKKKRMIHCIDF